MTLWLIFAVMTAAAVLAALWPFARTPRASRNGGDRAVYQDQLREIDRDRAAGLIGEDEAESARIEISRRLLTAADADSQVLAKRPQATRYLVTVAIISVVIVPVVAVGLYLKLGSPDLVGQSAYSRSRVPQDGSSLARLISRVEAHLYRNPNDGAGWEVIAPAYLRLGRFSDAAIAWRKTIELNGDTPKRESDLGEALSAAANGVVTEDAKRAFRNALAGDPNDSKARYFLGLADAQDGKYAAAAARWRALLSGAPPDAPWAGFVRAALVGVTAAAAPGTSPAIAAEDLSVPGRSERARAMVQELAEQLRADATDVDGWLRLVRAYFVLGDRDKANAAATAARRALQRSSEDVDRIDALVKDLGLEG